LISWRHIGNTTLLSPKVSASIVRSINLPTSLSGCPLLQQPRPDYLAAHNTDNYIRILSPSVLRAAGGQGDILTPYPLDSISSVNPKIAEVSASEWGEEAHYANRCLLPRKSSQWTLVDAIRRQDVRTERWVIHVTWKRGDE
jgi:hypothetical protein